MRACHVGWQGTELSIVVLGAFGRVLCPVSAGSCKRVLRVFRFLCAAGLSVGAGLPGPLFSMA